MKPSAKRTPLWMSVILMFAACGILLAISSAVAPEFTQRQGRYIIPIAIGLCWQFTRMK